MGKLTNVRERVHQIFYDHAFRVTGYGGTQPRVGDRINLFSINRSRGDDDIAALTNVDGSTLNSDQSFVILACRSWHILRAPVARGAAGPPLVSNGDYNAADVATFWGAAGPGAGQAPANAADVLRLHLQLLESAHISVGTGEKFSLVNVQHQYLPSAQGSYVELGGQTDLISVNNGLPSVGSLMRLARAILLPPRQNFKVEVTLYALPTGGNEQAAGLTQGARSMYSVRDNINCVDGMTKIFGVGLDGLHARDVQ